MYLAAHAEQVDKGVAEYGKTLHPFNGRNAADDCRRELVDALDYLTQLEMERDTYKAYADALSKALYEVAYPLRDLERKADAKGHAFNPIVAVRLSESADYLKDIARAAFEAYQEATK
jgi:hypothetical protein